MFVTSPNNSFQGPRSRCARRYLAGAPPELQIRWATSEVGGGLWAAALAMVSIPRVLPAAARILGLVASGLFAIVAWRIFSGAPLTALSTPLPFFAYPFLAATLLAWAWCERGDVTSIARRPDSSRASGAGSGA
jgi:hypothetical protein